MSWWFWPTLLLASALSFASFALMKRIHRFRTRLLWLAVGGVAALPAISMPLYYLHLYDDWAVYYWFRSIPGSELTASGLGLLAGALAAALGRAGQGRIVHGGIFALMTLVLLVSYVKPVLAPIDPAVFQNRWSDGMCLQSTQSCGAACAATMLKRFDVDATEREIAEESFTYVSGTENWYLARALRKRGMKVQFIVNTPESDGIPVPCIAGVRIGEAGHFICVFATGTNEFEVGEPLTGRALYVEEALFKAYRFTGFFMRVVPADSPAARAES